MTAWPPPPHDPRERILAGGVGDWELRCFAPDDPKYEYLVARGFWHVQLWHAAARVSVLTPSRLTGRRFELFPYRGWKAAAFDPSTIAELVRREHRVALPHASWLRALDRWFVTSAVREAGVAARCAGP